MKKKTAFGRYYLDITFISSRNSTIAHYSSLRRTTLWQLLTTVCLYGLP